ncbi:hypothetical protein BZG36_02343 [Bifiguratus adelaidae]|uniref:Nascent polypeptide-associated complex subunit alpha-like UBA domain-containing protein n=1 Tax=Bifiguratus adelaidae TaxID=1938954 RepID=A0A261Y2K8_9FUNG|nr:hypothetical protein BZG36_02343 [Bifiguratus adelaidae]
MTDSSRKETDKKVEDDEEEQQPQGQQGEAKKDMKRVTGYVAEDSNGRVIDGAKLKKAMNMLRNVNDQQRDEKLAKQVDAIKLVTKADVDVVMQELGVSKAIAERCLKEHQGELEATLSAMVVEGW